MWMVMQGEREEGIGLEKGIEMEIETAGGAVDLVIVIGGVTTREEAGHVIETEGGADHVKGGGLGTEGEGNLCEQLGGQSRIPVPTESLGCSANGD